MEVGTNMNDEWRELYRSALLELRPHELRQRIPLAEKAIQQRILELRREDSSVEAERLELEDAMHGLRALAAAECASLRPMSVALAGEALP